MKKIIGVIAALFLISGAAFADTATVNIEPSATRTDSTAFDPAGATYTFYRAPTSAGPFDTLVGSITETNRSITVPVEAQSYYVVFTTTDADGRVGPESASGFIPSEIAPPGAGTITEIIITVTP